MASFTADATVPRSLSSLLAKWFAAPWAVKHALALILLLPKSISMLFIFFLYIASLCLAAASRSKGCFYDWQDRDICRFLIIRALFSHYSLPIEPYFYIRYVTGQLEISRRKRFVFELLYIHFSLLHGSAASYAYRYFHSHTFSIFRVAKLSHNACVGPACRGADYRHIDISAYFATAFPAPYTDDFEVVLFRTAPKWASARHNISLLLNKLLPYHGSLMLCFVVNFSFQKFHHYIWYSNITSAAFILIEYHCHLSYRFFSK